MNNKKTTMEAVLVDMAKWSLAKRATYIALRRTHTSSGDTRIEQLLFGINKDVGTIESGNIDVALSDSADLIFEAYNAVADIKTLAEISSERAFKLACKAVNAEIYRHKSASAYTSKHRVRVPIKQNNGKIKMIALFEGQTFEDGKIIGKATSDKYRTESTCNPLTYIDDEQNNIVYAVNNIYGISNLEDYETVTELLRVLSLSDRDKAILRCRLRGLKPTDIGRKFNVSQSAISQRLLKMQKILLAYNPAYKAYKN